MFAPVKVSVSQSVKKSTAAAAAAATAMILPTIPYHSDDSKAEINCPHIDAFKHVVTEHPVFSEQQRERERGMSITTTASFFLSFFLVAVGYNRNN